MDFNATPLNMTTFLVVAVAIMAIVFLIKKQYDSNLPLLFYVAVFMLVTLTDRMLNTYLLYSGLALSLLLRFEFMGKGFQKFVGFLSLSAICLIVWSFFVEIFGNGSPPF